MGTIRTGFIKIPTGDIQISADKIYKRIEISQEYLDDQSWTTVTIPLANFDQFVKDVQGIRRDIKKLEA